MNEFNLRISKIDNRIKEVVGKTIESIGIDVDFQGYYIEDNDYSYSMSPQPIYSSIKEYISDNPKTGRITHIRYFFQLKKGNKIHQMSLTIDDRDPFYYGFSIDELAIGVKAEEIGELGTDWDLKMMIYKKFKDDIFILIDKKKREIDSFGKLSSEILNKINFKFRLDWNYYSNKMEGGTLTQPETRQVMAGVSVGPRPIDDVKEMEGHDKAVQEILHIAKGNLRISERRIKDFHKLIMSESNPDKAKLIGVWKKENNEVINYRGEKQEYEDYSLVPEKIHTILNKVNARLDAFFSNRNESINPLAIAVDFHLEYLYLHPFYDGNGRTARLLTNLILISCGFPPIIISDTSKERYYRLLSDVQSYGGDKDLFYRFMGERVLESQDVILKAINGIDISEENDLDKALSIFEQRLKNTDEKHKVEPRSKIKVGEILYKAFLPVVDEMNTAWKRLLPHFATGKIQIKKESDYNDYESLPEDLELLLQDVDFKSVNQIHLNFDLRRLKKALPTEISNGMEIRIHFNQEECYLTYYFNKEKQKKLFYGDEVIEESFRQEVRPLITQWVMDFNQQLENLNKQV